MCRTKVRVGEVESMMVFPNLGPEFCKLELAQEQNQVRSRGCSSGCYFSRLDVGR